MEMQRVEALKAEVETELIGVEAQFRALEARRAALLGLVKAYEAFILTTADPQPPKAVARLNGVALPKTITVIGTASLGGVSGTAVVSRSTDDNLTKRISRILASHAPIRLNARQILAALEEEDWTTTSKDPIAVIRNTMIDIRERVPEIDREQHGNTVTYGWTEIEEPAAAFVGGPDPGGG